MRSGHLAKVLVWCSGADIPLPFLLFVVVLIAHRGLPMTTTMTTTTANGLETSAAEH
jgi:hypothetical protein